MIYYCLAFLSSGLGAFGGLCVKQYDLKAGHIRSSSAWFNFLLAIVALISFAITGVAADGLAFHQQTFMYAILRAIGYVIGSYGYIEAVHTGPLLITIIISQMGSLIPIVFSMLFLHEQPDFLTIFGMIILFVALYLFNSKKGQKDAEPIKTPLYWLWVFSSFAGNGLTMLATKLQQYAEPGMHRSEYLFWSMLFVTAVFGIMLLVDWARLSKATSNIPKSRGIPSGFMLGVMWAAIYSLSNSAQNFIGTITVEKLPAIIAYMVSTGFGILFSFLIARFFYKEKVSKLQYAGIISATVGLFLLTSSDWLPKK